MTPGLRLSFFLSLGDCASSAWLVLGSGGGFRVDQHVLCIAFQESAESPAGLVPFQILADNWREVYKHCDSKFDLELRAMNAMLHPHYSADTNISVASSVVVPGYRMETNLFFKINCS